MLDNLKLGYGGTKEEMERLIADANAVKEANGEMADLSIDSFADVAEAIHIIQTEMGITGTTAREASSTIEGSLAMMKGAWQNLVVGMADSEANMEVLINNFVESTATAAQNLMPRIEQTLIGIGQLITALAPVIAEALPTLIASVLPTLLEAGISLVSAIVSGLITAAPALYESILSALYTTFTTVFGMSEESAGGFVTNLDGLFQGAFTAIETVFGALSGLASTIFGAISEAASGTGITWDDVFTGIESVLGTVADAIATVCGKIGEFVTWLNDGSAGAEVLKAVIIAITAAIVAYQTATAIGTAVTNGLAAAQTLLNAVMAMNPIGLVVAAVAALVAGFILLWNNCDGFRQFWIDLWEGIKSVFNAIVEWFKKAVEDVGKFFYDLWQGISDGASAAWDWIVGVFSTIGSWIYDNVIKPVADFFKGLWEGIVNAWHTVIDPWIEIVKRLASLIYDSVIKPVADFFVNLWNDIKEGASAAWEKIKGVFSVVANWFNKTIIKPVKDFFGGMWDGLKNGAKNAWDGITSVFSKVTDWFKDVFSKAWQKVKDVFSTGGQVFDGIKDGIVSVFKTVVNAIIGGINKVIAVPFNAINGILATIKGISILGVEPFSWVNTFSVPQIPKLSTGLNFVPYDEFPAFLHRGEAVLTAAQARAWRNGNGETALSGGNGQIVTLLLSILNAITGGNEEMIQAILADKRFVVGEREFARAVKTYA